MGRGDIIDKLFNYKDDEDSWSDGSTDESKIVNTNLATLCSINGCNFREVFD